MKRIVFGESVQSASHKRVEMECQDSYKRVEFDDGTVIMAVADGHGSKSCPYSKTGSKIAVNVFCKVMTDFYNNYANNLDMLMTYLNREGDTKVAQAVDDEWKKRILDAHQKHKREVPKTDDGEKNKVEIYKQYGTTLVGLLITSTFLFGFQIGDGDMIYVTDTGVEQILVSDKILGTETHSLSKVEAWNKAITVVRRKDNSEKLPALYMLMTDGFANSYKNEEEFRKTCADYFSMTKEYGIKTISANLKEWLIETTEQGCGDDITLLMCYFFDEDQSFTSVEDSEVAYEE